MRINNDNKSVDMEARDINYILPAYVRSYLFYSKNEMPEKIIFPMFPSVEITGADRKVTKIPIEYVPWLGDIAVEIAGDGSNVAEVTPEQEAALDEKDEEIARLKGEVEALAQTGRGGEEVGGTALTEVDTKKPEPEIAEDNIGGPEEGIVEEVVKPSPESPAKAAFAKSSEPAPKADPMPSDREPKQPPGGDIGPGAGPSDMQVRDRRDQARTARDLKEEPEIEEAAEKPFDKKISRDDQGRPVVEEKPDEQ